MNIFLTPSRIDSLINKLRKLDQKFVDDCGPHLRPFLETTRNYFRNHKIKENTIRVNKRLPDAYNVEEDKFVEIKTTFNHDEVFNIYKKQLRDYMNNKTTLVWIISPESVRGILPVLYELYD